MSTIYLVRYSDLDLEGTICAFQTEAEARKYELALEMEKDAGSEFLIFYTTAVKLYSDCEEVVRNG